MCKVKRASCRRRSPASSESRRITGASTSPVVPLMLGDEWRAYRYARRMLDDSIFVSAVVFPAVSPGQARLRLCATAEHRPEHFEKLFEAVEECRELEREE